MSKKKNTKKDKLQVKRDTLRKLDTLTDTQIKQVAGGLRDGTSICPTISNTCY